MGRKTTMIPSAARLMGSLRDIGYDLPSAVADLVDNSIDAGALNIGIDVYRKGERSFIRISDDGTGMTDRVLDEAMRYGSRRTYASDDLGKFGLGLKTASLSQCRCLTVATRSTSKGPIRIRRWDLDHVRNVDAWELERLVPSECSAYLIDPLKDRSGTVVVWEKLDRVLAYSRPEGEFAQRALEAAATEISEHLSMVFHRFLSGENAGRRVRIRFNGEPLIPWDPFARHERAVECLSEQQVALVHRGSTQTVRIRPYVLPSQIEFSSSEAHAAAAGPMRWNRQQGFYIYRADRMIQSGGWNRLRTTDEHSKLARIAVDIPPSLEGAFQINVAKMRVVLPEEIRPSLRVLAAGVVARAQDSYRRRLRVVGVDGEHAGDEISQRDATVAASGPWTLADVWPLISEILERELAEHPDLLDQVLVALANARPSAPPAGMAGSAGSVGRV